MMSLSAKLMLRVAVTLIVGMCLNLNPAVADEWQKAIERVEALSGKVYSKAAALGYGGQATALIGLDGEKHTCTILGRMLGKAAVVRHLEVEYPYEKETDGAKLTAMYHSLDSWLASAHYYTGLAREKRVSLWNLECAGKLGISHTERIAGHDSTAFFDVSEDGHTLVVLGEVNEGFADRLITALKQNPDVRTVSLGSPGGYVLEAITAGMVIRDLHLDTTTHASCYSACPIVFLGGVNRNLWKDAQLGFHRIRDADGTVPLDHDLYKLVALYASDMGVEPLALLRLMWSAGPDEMTIAYGETLCNASIATWIQYTC